MKNKVPAAISGIFTGILICIVSFWIGFGYFIFLFLRMFLMGLIGMVIGVDDLDFGSWEPAFDSVGPLHGPFSDIPTLVFGLIVSAFLGYVIGWGWDRKNKEKSALQ